MADHQSPWYHSFIAQWSKPILDTLDEIDSLQDGRVSGNVDGVVADILFKSNLIRVSFIKDMEAYSKTPQFSELYAGFKQTGLYRDMEAVRQAQKADSAR